MAGPSPPVATSSGVAGTTIVLILTLGYWAQSIFLTMYNKAIYTTYGFPFPTTLVACTFVIQFVVMYTRSKVMDHMTAQTIEVRRRNSSVGSEEGDGTYGAVPTTTDERSPLARKLSTGSMSSLTDTTELEARLEDVKIPNKIWWTLVVPTALCMAGEIFFNNASLLTLSVAFQTQLRSTRPLAVLLSALALGLQPFSWLIMGIITLICAGIALCADGEVHFAMSGFILMMISVLCGGCRWSLVQLLSQHLPGNKGRVALMELLLPICAAVMPPLALLMEGHGLVAFFKDSSNEEILLAAGLIVLCGIVTLLQLFVELSLVALTSSVTFSVLSISKNLMLLFCSITILGDEVSTQSGIGFGIALLGVVLYKFRPKDHRSETVPEIASSKYGCVPEDFVALRAQSHWHKAGNAIMAANRFRAAGLAAGTSESTSAV